METIYLLFTAHAIPDISSFQVFQADDQLVQCRKVLDTTLFRVGSPQSDFLVEAERHRRRGTIGERVEVVGFYGIGYRVDDITNIVIIIVIAAQRVQVDLDLIEDRGIRFIFETSIIFDRPYSVTSSILHNR
jgi:hypothetical protein